MSARTVFLVVSASPEHLRRLGLWAVTAASLGESVEVLLCAPALRALDVLPDEPADGLPSVHALLADARALAPVRIVTCDTEAHLAALLPDRVGRLVDEVVSLPSFWRALGDARVVTL